MTTQRLAPIVILAALMFASGCDQQPSSPTPAQPSNTGASGGEPKSPEARATDKPRDLPRWQGEGVSWVTPDTWEIDPTPKPLRFATLFTGAAETRVEIAVSKLGPNAGSVEANINRWATQVGLGALNEEELAKVKAEIDVSGEKAILVDLIGPNARMLAVMAPRADATWFVKMTAPDPTVGRYRDTFLKFVQSMKFE